jgi:hypothetical protein
MNSILWLTEIAISPEFIVMFMIFSRLISKLRRLILQDFNRSTLDEQVLPTKEEERRCQKDLVLAKKDLVVLKQSIANEEFLSHPHSIVALREVLPVVDGMYIHEAITADAIFDENG